ncbi:MAG: formate dehydrogenase, partial [Acidiphilium sp. 21-68-69]
GSAHGPADAIRVPVLKPDRDVRPFQDVLIDLAGRLGLPDFAEAPGKPLYSSYADYMVRHQRKPGVGPLAGFRGADGTVFGRGEPNPEQISRYIANKGFARYDLPLEQLYYKHANRAYLTGAKEMGLIDDDSQIVLNLYSEHLQKFRLAAEGHGAVRPPERLRARVARFMDPLPIWYEPIEQTMTDMKQFPLHAITQRPMSMYHSWGSHNAWLRQIHSENRLYVHRDLAAAQGLEDDDWVGAVALAQDAPEAVRGFLLNHVISEYLPAGDDGARLSNSDPVTGQAAWFDLTVRLEPCEPETIAETQPRMAPVALTTKGAGQ